MTQLLMMITTTKSTILMSLISILFLSNLGFSQVKPKTSKSLNSLEKLVFYDYRGTNAIEVAAGAFIANGDLPDAEFDLNLRVGYKRFIFNHLNVNLSYNKFNVVFKDAINEGYMSFDGNIEFLLSPYRLFSPFVFVGGGYSASNYFERASTKVQGGIGFEYIFSDKLGVKLFGEYNYMFTDELDGLVAGESDDTFFRIGFGFNIYFGGKKQKQKKLDKIDTVIKSNPILQDN